MNSLSPAWQHAYDGSAQQRRTDAEIRAWLRSRYGVEPVDGFTTMTETGDAVSGGPRIAGFMERHTLGEWLLPLSASKGMVWQTQKVPATSCDRIAFVLSLGFGNGSPLPQPSGAWQVFVNDRLAVTLRMVTHGQLWRQGECWLAFAANRVEAAEPFGSLCLSSAIRQESLAAFGPALLAVPAAWVETGSPAHIRVVPVARVPSTRWVQIEHSPGVVMQANIYRLAQVLDGPPSVGEWQRYFGDVHTHSGQVRDECQDRGCGLGSRRANYEYALGPGGLDFYALTDHEWQVDPARVDEYFALADEYEKAGQFVCLPAFEFTSIMYGHRNVYFRSAGGVVVNANRSGGHPVADAARSVTPAELWAALQGCGVPFLTVPHHPSSTSHPCNLGIFDERFDRLIEVYSVWGSSEYYGDFPRGVSDRFPGLDVRAALRHGHHFGLAAGADGHDGHPGDAQGPVTKHPHQYHFCGSGRTVVLAPELTRDAVFDALFERRCYATSGPPILLDVRVNGALMGQRLHFRQPGRPQVSLTCRGTTGIDHIRIVRNGHVVLTHPCHGEHEAAIEWEDTTWDGTAPISYYARVVQRDRESAWSSPIRLDPAG
jgi:hypothetical protein